MIVKETIVTYKGSCDWCGHDILPSDIAFTVTGNIYLFNEDFKDGAGKGIVGNNLHDIGMLDGEVTSSHYHCSCLKTILDEQCKI